MSRKPSVETAIAAVIQPSAPGPKRRRTVAAAGVTVAATPSRPSVIRYTTFTVT